MNATVSTKRNRVYPRAFDWDEARRLRNEGWTWNALAHHFKVSPSAVQQVVVPGLREKVIERNKLKQGAYHVGTCPDCGGRASQGRYRPGSRCRDCDARARTVSVRPDTLRCTACRLWFPDEEFSHKAAASKPRRGRHSYCRPCSTVMKRDWRKANAERRQRAAS